MFKVGDLVYCDIRRDESNYSYDRAQPLTIVALSDYCVHLIQPGLWHAWRKFEGTPCLIVDIMDITPATNVTPVSKQDKIIAKIKYLDKRFHDRRASLGL